MLKSKITKLTKRYNILAFPQLNLNYWGINKVATSTMCNHLLIQTGATIDTQNKSGQVGKRMTSTLHIDRETAYTNGLINFAIVRSPYARFESCYRHFKYPKDDVQSFGSRKAKFHPVWSPDDFLDHIEKVFAKGKIGNKHYSKQSWFIPEPERLDHVIKLENLVKNWPFDFSPPNFVSNPTTRVWNIKYNKDKLQHLYAEDFNAFGY